MTSNSSETLSEHTNGRTSGWKEAMAKGSHKTLTVVPPGRKLLRQIWEIANTKTPADAEMYLRNLGLPEVSIATYLNTKKTA